MDKNDTNWHGGFGLFTKILLYGGNIIMLPQILLFIAHIVAGDKYSSQKYFLLEVMGNISYVLIFMFAEFTFVVGLPILTLVCCGICGKLYGIRTAEIAAVSGYILGLICVLLMYGQDFMAFFF